MASDYYLLFKTAPAEFRAWEHLSSDQKRLVCPIVELTRGRKRRGAGDDLDPEALLNTPDVYAFDRLVARVESDFSEIPRIILDVTREESLGSFELNQLASEADGYAKWIEFLRGRRDAFEEIVPTLIVNPEEGGDFEDFERNLVQQAGIILDEFPGVAYRASTVFDPDFLSDIVSLQQVFNDGINAGRDVIIILDHEFIRPGTGIVHAARTIGLIERIRERVPGAKIVTIATSFPRAIEDLGDEEHDSFPMEEVFLNQEINKNVEGEAIAYGDYGSINPTRNDISFATSWRPRIDFPTSNLRTFYYREKKLTDYSDHYESVAEDVVEDAAYEHLEDCWGCEMIEDAAEGDVPGKSPSFWISVRMNIHIIQQLNRLSAD